MARYVRSSDFTQPSLTNRTRNEKRPGCFSRNRGVGINERIERQLLPAIIKTKADTLHPEVGSREPRLRGRRANQAAAAELAGIDVAIDLVSGQQDLIPVDERVADHRSPV